MRCMRWSLSVITIADLFIHFEAYGSHFYPQMFLFFEQGFVMGVTVFLLYTYLW